MFAPASSFRALLENAGRPLVGAHRGASADYPENTSAAFAGAAAQGADFWEIDVRLSADGVPVVIHDATVDRTTRGRGAVARMTATMLEGLGVPALATVLAMGAGRTLFNVELKADGGGDDLAAAVMSVIGALRLTDKVLVSSFDHGMLPRVKALSPTVLTAVLYEEPLPDPPAYARSLGAHALHPYFRLAGARLVNAACDAGLAVIPWTVDRLLYLRYFTAVGAHGIITNRPGIAATIVAR